MSFLIRSVVVLSLAAPLAVACSAAPGEDTSRTDQASTFIGIGTGSGAVGGGGAASGGGTRSADPPPVCSTADPTCSVQSPVDYSYFDQLVLAGYSCANPASYVQSDPNYVEQINYMICADTPSLRNYVKSTGGSDPDFTGPWAPGMHALMGVVSDAGLGGVCNTCLGPAPAGKVYVMWTTPNATTYHILNHCTCCMTPPGI